MVRATNPYEMAYGQTGAGKTFTMTGGQSSYQQRGGGAVQLDSSAWSV
jgi:hypothetical protein